MLNKIKQQRNIGFRREVPKAWCPKTVKGKAYCEYRTIDSTCKPPSYSEQQCLDKFPCQLIKTYQGPDKEKLKNICRAFGKHGKDLCLSDNPQYNAKDVVHTVLGKEKFVYLIKILLVLLLKKVLIVFPNINTFQCVKDIL